MIGIIVPYAKIVYWVIPKNACTSIKQRLAEMMNIPFDKDILRSVHDAPFNLTTIPISEYTNVAFVRHPIARLYSLYANKFIDEQADSYVFQKYGEKFDNIQTFSQFIEAVVSIPSQDADPHFALQSGQIPEFCLVYKLEDANPIMKMFLPQLNTSKYNNSWQEVCSDSDVNKLIEHYWEDFERFGYTD